MHSGWFLGRLLGPLLKNGLKNVFKPLAKSAFLPLGLTSTASSADAGIHKKDFQIRDEDIHNFK